MKGITLIELLIIVAIIGIILGTGIPVLLKSLQPDLQLSSVLRDLVSDLRWSQQTAITEQIYSGLTFSTVVSPHQYQIVKYGSDEEIIEVIREKELPSEISFSQINFTDQKVMFNPYGAAKEGGTIVLISTENKTGTIEVRPSGFAKIID